MYKDEIAVQRLIDCCIMQDGKLYLCVSSPTIKDKPVQIRPWNLADADFVMDGSQPLDPRKTIFVGGVPRPLRAVELAMIMDRLYGGVCYAGIDVDPELKYPKGAGRVAFSNQQSYIAAISARFIQLQHGEIDKRVRVLLFSILKSAKISPLDNVTVVFLEAYLAYLEACYLFRLKLSLMFWMIRCVMNVMVFDAMENLLHFSVQI